MSITPRTLRIPPDIVSLAAPFVHTCVWRAWVVLARAFGTVILPPPASPPPSPPPPVAAVPLTPPPMSPPLSPPTAQPRSPLPTAQCPPLPGHPPPLPLSHHNKKIVFVPLDPTITPTLPTSSPPTVYAVKLYNSATGVAKVVSVDRLFRRRRHLGPPGVYRGPRGAFVADPNEYPSRRPRKCHHRARP